MDAAAGSSLSGLVPDKPRLRGVIHQWSFFVALVAGVALVVLAPPGRATAAAAIYAAALAGLLGTSALYHRVTWRPSARTWMRRADHSMIFVLIAGTYTPFALLLLSGSTQVVVLAGVWAGAAAGVVFALIWVRAPKWLSAVAYVSLGWFAMVASPQIVEKAGVAALVLIFGGGVFYTAGAVVYALHKPNPYPATFGYHEVFHALVVLAALAQYVAVFSLAGGE